MTVRVKLLGAPEIIRGEESLQPRGRKSWALLARLALSRRPLRREVLARLLFHQADDPAGALRWSLADLRRSLGRADLLKGDPLSLPTDAQLHIDALHIESAGAPPADLGGELLDGTEPDDCPEFSAWLLVERHRLRARQENALRDAAHRRAATGDWAGALDLAARAVNLNGLDESLQELFVRCLAMTGDRRGADAQVRRCEKTFRDELGREPSIALRVAASSRLEHGGAAPASGKAAITALLEAGQAAIDVGAVDAGIDTLRRAMSDARRAADPALGARCALALGGALVHALRGRDEEGASLLHGAVVMARESEQDGVAADALRELGYVDVQAGRRQQAGRVLDEAAELAAGDDRSMSAILGVSGMNLSDFGSYADAQDKLQESVDRAFACDRLRQAAWSLSVLGRLHVLRGEGGEAIRCLERSLELVRSERWTAFAPLPQTLRAELMLRESRGPDAELIESLQGTFALACQVADPCWEGMAARALALAFHRGGDPAGASRWIDEAEVRCNRTIDRYVWIQAYVLDGRCELLIADQKMDEAAEVAAQMAALAARTEQREHLTRALGYQARAGGRAALEQARLVLDEIDNPALHGWLQQQEGA